MRRDLTRRVDGYERLQVSFARNAFRNPSSLLRIRSVPIIADTLGYESVRLRGARSGVGHLPNRYPSRLICYDAYLASV